MLRRGLQTQTVSIWRGFWEDFRRVGEEFKRFGEDFGSILGCIFVCQRLFEAEMALDARRPKADEYATDTDLKL